MSSPGRMEFKNEVKFLERPLYERYLRQFYFLLEFHPNTIFSQWLVSPLANIPCDHMSNRSHKYDFKD